MYEPSVSISKAGAYLLWTVTTLLLLSGLVVFAAQRAELGIMLATAACVTGLGATTLTARCYARHVARLVRMTAGMPMPESRGQGLRSVRE